MEVGGEVRGVDGVGLGGGGGAVVVVAVEVEGRPEKVVVWVEVGE